MSVFPKFPVGNMSPRKWDRPHKGTVPLQSRSFCPQGCVMSIQMSQCFPANLQQQADPHPKENPTTLLSTPLMTQVFDRTEGETSPCFSHVALKPRCWHSDWNSEGCPRITSLWWPMAAIKTPLHPQRTCSR